MCKILTLKERESLAKLTKLVEGLTNKKIVLESRKDCNCCGDKKSLKENTHNFKNSDFVKSNSNKRYSVYELMHGQPTRFWNEIQNNFTYEVKNATLYTKEEAEVLANKLLQPRIEKYQKDGKNYSELHIGDLFKKGMLKEAYTTNTIASLKSYMGNKGEKVYITPTKVIAGARFPEFRLINASNYWMINMTFSSPTEAKKYATKRELTIVPKPKETFSENIATVALYFGQHQLYTNVKIERAKQILKYLESIGEDLSDYFVWKSGTSEPIPANEIGWNLTNTTLPEHFNAEGLKKKLEQLNNLQESKKTLKENPFTIKRIKKYLEQELESLKPKTVTESTEGIQRIKMQYSKENISRLWDFFSIKTRKMIANSDSAWENKDININSLFAKQNERGQNAIIEYFEHHGVNKLIDINKRTMKESKQNLKEGVWALPKDAVARRKAMNFKQELQRIKTDIYNIAGSDDLYNALDNAIESLDQLITAGKSQGNV